MALDEVERKAERHEEKGGERPDSAAREASDGRMDLIRQQREETERLRAGGSTGYSGDFGKLLISGLDSGRDRGVAAPPAGERAESAQQSERREETRDEGGALSRMGRMLADGLQSTSQALRLDRLAGGGAERAPESRSGQDSQRPADRPSAVEPDSRPGGVSRSFGRMMLDGLNAISGGFRRPARETIESRDATSEVREPRTINDGVTREMFSVESWAQSFRDDCVLVGANEESILNTLEQATPEQLSQADAYYRQTFGMGLADQVRDDMSGEALARATEMLRQALGTAGDGGTRAADAGSATRPDARTPGDFVPIQSADADPLVRQYRAPAIDLPPETADAPPEGTSRGTGGDRPSEPAVRERPREGERGRTDVPSLGAHPDFHGEVINRDVAPDTHTFHRGETLDDVAARHLGEGASREDIARHVREIERVNHLDARHRPSDGQELTLPGHTADGGYVTRDADGNRHTVWADGVHRDENADGVTGRVVRPGTDGTYSEHHWGPRPEDNYETSRTADGHYLINGHDRLADIEREIRERPGDHAAELERLHHISESLRELDERAQRDGLSPDQVGRTYREVLRLVDSPDVPHGPDRAERLRLADEIMRHAAHPTDINQGEHRTCNTAAVETLMYSRNPAEAARLVTDVALTGHYRTTTGGTDLEIGRGLRRPDREARHEPPEHDGDRDYASQIFQTTAVNIRYARHGYTDDAGHEYAPGEVYYTQTPFREIGGSPPDTGERLRVRGDVILGTRDHEITDADGNPMRRPNLEDDEIAEIATAISGGEPPVELLGSRERSIDEHGHPVEGSEHNLVFSSERDLGRRLAELSHEGRLPAPILVHSSNPPFFNDSGAGVAGGSGGWHLVTVTGFNEATGRVSLDNQWGPAADHTGDRSLSVHDLYLSTLQPGSREIVEDLRRSARRERDPEDRLQAQLDLAREERAAGTLSDSAYNSRISSAADDYFNGIRREGPPATPEVVHERALALVVLSGQIESLPPASQQEVMSGIDNPLDRRAVEAVREIVRRERERAGGGTGADSTATDAGDLARSGAIDSVASRVPESITSAAHLDHLLEARTAGRAHLEDLRRTGELPDGDLAPRMDAVDRDFNSDMARYFNRSMEQWRGAGADAPEASGAAGGADLARQFVGQLHALPEANAREIAAQVNDPMMRSVLSASLDMAFQRLGRAEAAPPGSGDSPAAPTTPNQPGFTRQFTQDGREEFIPITSADADPVYRQWRPREITLPPDNSNTRTGNDNQAVSGNRPAGNDGTAISGNRQSGNDNTTTGGDRQSGNDNTRAREGDQARESDSPSVRGRHGHVEIRRDIEPAVHHVQHGETLEAIARGHLGQGAREDEVRQHARDIAALNGIERGHRPQEGSDLRLPGYTQDGGMVQVDDFQTRTTTWRDGVVRVEEHKRGGYVMRPDGTEHHWGPRRDDNYDRQADGRLIPLDRPGAADRVTDGPLTEERQRLDRLIDNPNLTPEQQTSMRLDMERFERRAAEAHPPLTREQMDRTYDAISDMMEAPGDHPIAQAERIRMAQQVMHHAAEPNSVDQGYHGTCNVATVESTMYTRHPEAAARMVSDVSTTGQFRTTDGRVVTVPESSIHDHQENAAMSPESVRDHASQVFQISAVNVHYAYHVARDRDSAPGSPTFDQPINSAGETRYEQITPPAGTAPDTGERLIDTRTGRVIAHDPRISTSDLPDINYQISGERVEGTMLTNNPYDTRADGMRVSSQADLEQRLDTLQREGRLPATIEVFTQSEPFWTDSGAGAAGGSGAWHVVTVTGYNPDTHQVSFDNQWGESHDHEGARSVSSAALYRAMSPSAPAASGSSPHQSAALSRSTPESTVPAEHFVPIQSRDADSVARQWGARDISLPVEPGDLRGRDTSDLSPDRAAEMRWRESLRAGRESLDRAIDMIDNTEIREHMRRNMDDFERRAQEHHMDAAQVRDTYADMARLMEDPEHRSPLAENERRLLAMQVLRQAAHPEEVNQGGHATCNVATVEARTYSQSPASAAHLVTQVALAGSYLAPSGTRVTMPADELNPDRESINPGGHGNRNRSYASQIFQQTAVNLHYATHDFDGRRVRYQVDPVHGFESLVDAETGVERSRSPSLHGGDLIGISNAVTGRHESPRDLVISHESINDGNSFQMQSEEQLRSRLMELQSAGRLPVIVEVHTGNEPFYTDSDAARRGSPGGWHVVTITGFNAETGVATMDNQWGPNADHAVGLHELYMASQNPSRNAETLERDAQWNRTHPDSEQRGWAELEALRLRHSQGQMMDDRAYYDGIVSSMVRLEQTWRRHERAGDLDTGARDRARQRYRDMLRMIAQGDPGEAASIEERIDRQLAAGV